MTVKTLSFSKTPHPLKIASWNVNSVRARLPLVVEWLVSQKPDVVCLQETKCEDKNFPFEAIEDLGYNVAHFGQKTFNGVAILSKYPLDDVQKNLPNFEDTQSRYIEAGFNVGENYVRVASVYVPNGQEVGSEKYIYKLAFLKALYARMKEVFEPDSIMLFAGDYNIAPTDKDVYDPGEWHEKILCSEEERRAFQRLCHLGYTDILGFEEPRSWTWWDYRGGNFQKNQGLRIDHLLASPRAADMLQKYFVDTAVRGLEKTSDHAPVIVEMLLKNH